MRIERNRYLAPLQPIGDYKSGGGSAGVKPNSIYLIDYENNSVSSDTWYTMLDVSTGKGSCGYIALWNKGDFDQSQYLSLRATVDGVEGLIFDVPGLTEVYAQAIGTTLYNQNNPRLVTFMNSIEFSSSLKIEFKATAGWGQVYGVINYGLVV